MIERNLFVSNGSGIHIRPASQIATLSSSFKCRIFLKKGVVTANAKSIMGIIALKAIPHSSLTLICDGEDEERAADEIEKLFLTRFGE